MGFEKCKFYVLVWADNSEPLPQNVHCVLVWSGVTWADNSDSHIEDTYAVRVNNPLHSPMKV